MSFFRKTIRRAIPGLAGLCFWLGLAAPADAQFAVKWLSAGSLHNWYSEIGNEIEEGLVREQQYGLRWPGIYRYTDMQAAKGFWIGARNVTGPEGTSFPVRVVHVGPRVTGAGEFFPVRFTMKSRFEPPAVFVNGSPTGPEAGMVVDEVDPDLPADRIIESEVNTLLGVTMQRNIYQFSNEYHDNYHVIEYVFTNTGNTDADPEIEVANQTLEDVMFFWQWRWSVAKNTRYLIGNQTGWGINNMVDARGDGLDQTYGTTGQDFRAMFSWHGYFPGKAVSYHNLGGPIIRQNIPTTYIAASDTLGRLGASQFIGTVVLHADASPGNTSDDPAQPSVMKYFDSDARFLSNNDPFTATKMQDEYSVMTTDAPDRHAYRVEPSGLPGFISGTNDPSLGTSGGHSAAMGFGPYTLAPGQSVRIVMAEAAAGLSRQANATIGSAYKAAGTNDAAVLPVTLNGVGGKTKNEWVFTSRDSLFQTFERALTNFESGYEIAQPPLPPSQLLVEGLGDRIALTWEVYPGEAPDGFEIYRAQGSFDELYELIDRVDGNTRSFNDESAIRGLNYYYYVQAVKGATSGNDGVPAGRPLRSSRYFAQTYDPATLQRPQGERMSDIRVVPNPYYYGERQGQSNLDSPRFDVRDKLTFYNVPGKCRIEIFTELGEKIDEINHQSGTGDVVWNHTTSSRQVVASGVYIAVITVTEDIPDANGGLLFQQGESTYLKFVVIR